MSIDELIEKVNTIRARCEINELRFDNDDVSAVLSYAEQLEKQIKKNEIDQEINRLEAIRDNESISIDERYKAAAEILRLIDAELQRAKRLAMVLLIRSEQQGVK